VLLFLLLLQPLPLHPCMVDTCLLLLRLCCKLTLLQLVPGTVQVLLACIVLLFLMSVPAGSSCC
jgi:hypothetical protein